MNIHIHRPHDVWQGAVFSCSTRHKCVLMRVIFFLFFLFGFFLCVVLFPYMTRDNETQNAHRKNTKDIFCAVAWHASLLMCDKNCVCTEIVDKAQKLSKATMAHAHAQLHREFTLHDSYVLYMCNTNFYIFIHYVTLYVQRFMRECVDRSSNFPLIYGSFRCV